MSKPKELYLYSGIYDFIVADLLAEMENNSESDVVLRVNSPGGYVFAGWGLIAKMQERTKSGYKTNIKVDGTAMSMAAFMLIFADEVEAMDVSVIMLHRADMYISSPEDQAFLDRVNKSLRAKLEAKIDDKLMKELKGVSIADLFEGEKRIDLMLSAAEAKKIGLVDKITKVNPKEVEAYNEKFKIAATAENPINNPQMEKLTLEKIKAENPALYNEIIALGEKQGVTKERDRVTGCLAYLEIDKDQSLKMVKEGTDLTPGVMAEFQVKAMNKTKLKAVKETSKENETEEEEVEEEVEATEKEKKIAQFKKDVEARLKKNLGKK